MFPTNLHKNIVQLDRQISLLENECKNMEVDKRKNSRREHSFSSKSSKISHLKSPPGKVLPKKSSGYECSKKIKKLTPPISNRVYSTSSLQSSKPWSEICESVLGKKDKLCGANSDLHVCSCQMLENSNLHLDQRKDNKCMKSLCCKEKPVSDLSEEINQEPCVEKSDEYKKNQVLHKEVLFSNPDGTIEVTVVKKSNNKGKENLPIKKYINLRNEDGDKCNCESKGQKWCEILGFASTKRRGITSGMSTKPQLMSDETQIIYEHNSEAVQKNEVLTENCQNKRSEISDAPVKLESPSRLKKPIELHTSPPEKETQCYLDVNECKKAVSQTRDPIKLFQMLVDELKQRPKEMKKMLLNDMEDAVINDPVKSTAKGTHEKIEKYPAGDMSAHSKDIINGVKQQCESLVKEKEVLSEELKAKDNIIATMKKREEEYLSLISSLKSNLEKTKENAQDGITAMKELNNIRSKLLEEMKVSEALKLNVTRMQKNLEKYILENQKLKTQMQIFKLESEKHNVLLAGKEAEINRYKEEIRNFQSQISDHLNSLKSNAQGVDVEKMMEAIIQQSHLFVQTDMDSVLLEKERRSSSKQQNVLMHSSPTSTKTSMVNSSWKQISSIRENDQDRDPPKTNSDFLMNLNDSDEKEFFQVFGTGNSSDTDSSKKSKETLIEKPPEKDTKTFTAFKSCISVRNDDDCGQSSKQDADLEREIEIKEIKKCKQTPLQKVQSNIDELLQNMKLKWSKEVYGTSRGESTIDDFLNNSQISSLTMISENVPSFQT